MEIEKSKFCIRTAFADEYEKVMGLVWKTFLRFEAEDYSPLGVENFQNFITDQTLKKLYDNGQYPIFVAVYRDEIIGMLSIRSSTHISLLFVDEAYHYNGVARSLMERACTYIVKELDEFKLTVNASPYAIGFYHKMGFVDMDREQEKDGIKYTPMSLIL